jgi:hypothetical protein
MGMFVGMKMCRFNVAMEVETSGVQVYPWVRFFFFWFQWVGLHPLSKGIYYH